MKENKPPPSKSHKDFWKDRLFRRGVNPDWQVQIGYAGHQERIPLRTPNKEAAAEKAQAIWKALENGKGWKNVRKEWKPWTNHIQKIESPTVGEFLAAVEAYGGIHPLTLKSYTRKFRRLVAALHEIKSDATRFHRGAGSEAWRKSVDVMQLASLTAGEINQWKDKFIAAHRGDPLKERHARATAQSILRNSKSLFSKSVFRHFRDAKVDLQLPSPLPFDGVEIVKKGEKLSHRYTSTIDAEKLAREASKELPKQDTELFKIFLLAFGVGLRRGEIDRLTWPQFNWSKDQINVVITAHGDTKTESSIAAVDVDPVVMKMFLKFKAKATGEFVIESTVKPRPGANWHHYRCDCAFKRLNSWLHDKGLVAQKPLHTLRKEFGSRICEQFGIFAASEALRHSDIRLTRAHYVDRRGRIHLEVGKMLKGTT